MAAITDLTWQQLQTASGLNNLIEVHQTEGLKIRLSAILGSIITDINATGVIRAQYQLREWAAKAQTTVNTNQAIGERLNSFPPASSGSVSAGYVLTSGNILVKVPLNTSAIVGANN